MISIICVYNDKKKLKKYLLKSLKNQTTEYQLILVDNSNNNFESAAKALNYGGKEAINDFLMFVHQDVDLKSDNWLKYMEENLRSLENLGVAGLAGVNENNKELYSNIKHGIPPEPAGNEIKNCISVQTVDECVFIIPKKVFKKHKFDEKLNGWHLYAVDYCLNIKKRGLNVFVIPSYTYHLSHGYSMSPNFYKILKKVLNKYRKDYNIIYTTCGNWKTTSPIILQRIIYFVKSFF